MFAAIARQVTEARMTGYKEIVHIRVTVDAIPGSIVAVPVTPERARVLGKLIAIDMGKFGTAVEADRYDAERLLELLIHPEDWATLMIEKDDMARFVVEPGLMTGGPDRVMGIPVTRA